MKRILLFFSIVTCLAVSCGKDDITQQPVLPGGVSVSISEAVYHPTGGEYALAVTFGSKWHFEGIPSWLTVTDSRGKAVDNGDRISSGTTSFKLQADINEEMTGMGTVRSSTLRLVSEEDDGVETIEVEQPCPYLVITAKKPGTTEEVEITSDDFINFDWNYTKAEPFNEDALVLTVYCNTDWNISQTVESQLSNAAVGMDLTKSSTLNSWLEAPDMGEYKENKEKKHTIAFVPETYNTTGRDRNLTMRIEGPKGRNGQALDSYTIDFSQNNIRFVVATRNTSEINKIDFAPCHTDEVTVNVDSEIDWSITDATPWLAFSPDVPKGENNNESTPAVDFTVNVNHSGTTGNANPLSVIQNGSFVVKGSIKGVVLTYPVIVTQQPYVFEIDKTSQNITNNDLTIKNLSVASSGDWVVETPEWIAVDKKTGNGGKDVKENIAFNAKGQNLQFSKRTGNITVKSTLNDMNRTVAVSQDEFIFDANASTTTIKTLETPSCDLNIQSSGDWSVAVSYDGSPVANWLELNTTSGNGNATVVYKPKEGNHNDTDRVAKLTVKSVTHENAGSPINPIEFTIKHSKYIFEVTPSTEEVLRFTSVPTGETYTLEVKCSADWTITAPDWINVRENKNSRDVNGSVVITADNNTGFTPREGNVAISSTFNGVTKQYVYKVQQAGFVFNVEPVSFSDIPAVPGSQTWQGIVNCDSDWSASGDNWITTSPASGNSSARNVNFIVANNLEKTPRTGVVTMESVVGRHTQPVTFSQKAFEFDEEAVNSHFVALNTASEKVNGTCSATWSVQGLPAWITVDKTSGSGNYTITFTPKPNYQLAPRQTDNLRVLSTLNNLTKSIGISQDAFVYDTAEQTLNKYEAVAPGGMNVIIGECLGTWKLNNVPSWITPDKTSGSGNTTVTFTAAENYTPSDRNAVIRFESQYINENTELVKLVRVSQKAFVFDTQAATIPAFEALEPGSKTVVLGESMSTWKVQDVPSWLTVSPMSGTGSATLTIKADENIVKQSRTASFKIVSDKNASMYKEVTVSQKAFVFDTQAATIPAYEALEPGSKTVVMGESMSTWKVQDVPSWLTVSPMNGTGSATLTVSADENVENTSRTAKFRIVSDKNTTLSKEVTVRQNTFVFDVAPVTVPQFKAIEPATATVTLGASMGGWTVDNNVSWIKVIPGSGIGATNLTVEVEENTLSTPRSGSFRIVSSKNTSMIKVVSVSQEAFVFDTKAVTVPEFDALSPAAMTVSLGASMGGWTVENNIPWLKVTPASGTGGANLKLEADDNILTDKRSGSFRIVSSKNTSMVKVVSVSQEAFVFDTKEVTVPEFTALSPAVTTVSLGTSMGGWTVEGCPSWIKVTPTTGSGSSSLTVEAQNNVQTTPRNASFRIVSEKNPLMVKAVYVSQAAFVFETGTYSAPEFEPMANNSQQVKIGAYLGEINVENRPEWVNVSINGGSATISVSHNTSANERTATLTLRSAVRNDLYKQLTVSQKAYLFSIASGSLEFGAEETTAKTVSVQCSGTWTVSASASWIHAEKVGNNVSVTVDVNDGEDRDGSVIVKSLENTEFTATIPIKQNKKVIINQ